MDAKHFSASGFSKLSTSPMVILINSRLDLLLRGTFRRPGLITVRLFPLWLNSRLSGLLWQSLQLMTLKSSNSTLKLLFGMGILQSSYTWSNQKDLLIYITQIMSAFFEKPYRVSSRLLGTGTTSFIASFCSLDSKWVMPTLVHIIPLMVAKPSSSTFMSMMDSYVSPKAPILTTFLIPWIKPFLTPALRITCRRDTHELFLDQTHYLTKLVRKFGFLDAVPLSVPADPHTHLSFLSSDTSISTSHFPYQTIVGCLQFACIGTRPYLSYVVSVAAKYCSNPSPAHCNALRRILKYLAGTLNLGLSFSGDDHPLSLTACSDADFAMDLDDRKSRLGFIMFMIHDPVFWAFRKQASCASSTTEAKYLAAFSTTKEIIWHWRLLDSLVKPPLSPTPLFTNNQSALHLIKNPEFHRRTKHIDVQYHVIREAFLADLLLPSFVSSHDQIPDIFTKVLPKESFNASDINWVCALLSIEWEIGWTMLNEWEYWKQLVFVEHCF